MNDLAGVLPEFEAEYDTVLVVDFGAQYAQLIARRVREANVYSEIVPHTITAAEIAERAPAGVIFSGGPKAGHPARSPGRGPRRGRRSASSSAGGRSRSTSGARR